MISEVMNSVLLFATFVLSDIQVENCVYYSQDNSCSGALQNGKCTSLCRPSGYDCSSATCSEVAFGMQTYYQAELDDCYTYAGYDVKTTCVGDDNGNGGNGNGGNGNGGNDNGANDNGGNDNGANDNGGNDNGGNDNGGNDNGGNDNGANDNGDDDQSQDEDVTIGVITCFTTNGSCGQCEEEIEFDISAYGYFSTCEEVKTHISRGYGGFEDYDSCFTQTTAGMSGYDYIFTCSGGAAASSSSDNTGMIVGIVIGCIVLVAGIVTFVFCMKKQNKL